MQLQWKTPWRGHVSYIVSNIDLILLSHYCSITLHLLLIGPPGTAAMNHLGKGTRSCTSTGYVRSGSEPGSLYVNWAYFGDDYLCHCHFNGVTWLLNERCKGVRWTAVRTLYNYPLSPCFHRSWKHRVQSRISDKTLIKSKYFAANLAIILKVSLFLGLRTKTL